MLSHSPQKPASSLMCQWSVQPGPRETAWRPGTVCVPAAWLQGSGPFSPCPVLEAAAVTWPRPTCRRLSTAGSCLVLEQPHEVHPLSPAETLGGRVPGSHGRQVTEPAQGPRCVCPLPARSARWRRGWNHAVHPNQTFPLFLGSQRPWRLPKFLNVPQATEMLNSPVG